jgi:hypothetical protein
MVTRVKNLFSQIPFAEYKYINDYIGDIKAKPDE